MSQQTNIEKTIEILRATDEGNKLSPGDLYLTEMACNGFLNKDGEIAFAKLYDDVSSGKYVQPWMYGIEGLTRDHEGYILWKGKIVEHYSFSDKDKEKRSAQALAEQCLKAESKGFPVNTRTISNYSPFVSAPAGTPWLEIMLCYYTVFADTAGKCKWLVVNTGKHNAIAMSVVCGEIVTMYALATSSESGLYIMYHRLEKEGLTSSGDRLDTYEGFVECMTEAGITPEMVARTIKAGFPATLLEAA